MLMSVGGEWARGRKNEKRWEGMMNSPAPPAVSVRPVTVTRRPCQSCDGYRVLKERGGERALTGSASCIGHASNSVANGFCDA